MDIKLSLPQIIFRSESFIFLLSALLFYHFMQASWIEFFLFFFLPDISALAYLTKNKRIGAIVYNFFHNYVLVVSLFLLSIYMGTDIWMRYSVILFAHINFDRLIGYGLRYTDIFRITHMQKV